MKHKANKEDFFVRKNFGAKPYTYPQPVFIIGTYGADGTPNAMNAAWRHQRRNRTLHVSESGA